MQEEQSRLTREQKEAIGLLSIGTFLEYFDLMLYVHMAVILNDLFFPQSNPQTTSLLSASSFCAIFVFRPIGALLFGWIGDNIGRKTTVVITTFMMAVSCVVMANLPTYAQVGITASWAITICRIIQGMTSMGEVVGAEIYLTEITKPPVQYTTVSLMVIFATLGGTAALAIAFITTYNDFNWRIAFWIGGIVAIIGAVARRKLRETPDFVDMKKMMFRAIERESGITEAEKFLESPDNPMKREEIKKITILALFAIQCLWPICLYFTYIHCGSILKSSFGYSVGQVIFQNFIVSMGQLASYLFLLYLVHERVYPLAILKVKLIIFSVFIFVLPYLLYNIDTSFKLLMFQLFIVIFVPTGFPAVAILYKHFPVFKRFTYTSTTFALVHASMHILNSFGLVYLIKYFGHYGVLIIMIPALIGYMFGLFHFEKLEKNNEALLVESKNAFKKLFGTAESFVVK